MIEVQRLNANHREAWNRYIDCSPNSIAWQVFDWADVVARHYEYEFIPLAALEGNAIRGVLPLYFGPCGKGSGLISVPFAVAGGAVWDSVESGLALCECAIEISKYKGNVPLILKQYKFPLPGTLERDETYINRELSLRCDPKALRQEVSESNLAHIEAARKAGLDVEYPAQNVPAFYDLLLRYHTAQGLPCTSETWIRTLIDFGMYSLALARVGGRIVAATMVKKFKKTVSFPFACVHPGDRAAADAAYGMIWVLINRFATEGFQIFHSGRIPKTQTVAGFRLGWGGTEYPYYYQSYPAAVVPGEAGARRGWKRRIVSAAWKRMPLSLARRLGPRLVRRFP